MINFEFCTLYVKVIPAPENFSIEKYTPKTPFLILRFRKILICYYYLETL